MKGIDDPKLTAYALGELRGGEQRALEKELAGNEALREEVDATTRIGIRIRQELRDESAAFRLGDDQRKLLLTRPKQAHANPLPAFIPVFGTAIAASFAIALWISTRQSDGTDEQAAASSGAAEAAELITPEITISFMPGESEVAGATLAGSPNNRTPAPSLPDPSLFQRTHPLPVPAAGPQLASSDKSGDMPGHPTTIDTLGDRHTHFGPSLPGDPRHGNSAPAGMGEFVAISEAPLMGLSMTAVGDTSFHRLRNALREGRLPDPGTLRVEELVNHFDYSFPDTAPGEHFAVGIELGKCPWAEDHLVAKIDATARPRGNRSPGAVATAAGLQVSFNPNLVASYRLLGFRGKKAGDPTAFLASGDVQPGQRISALYEIVPVRTLPVSEQDPDRLRLADHAEDAGDTPAALLGADVLYQLPGATSFDRIGATTAEGGKSIGTGSDDLRFATAVAAFSLHLEGDESVRGLTLDEIAALARSAAGNEPSPDRREFVDLVETAAALRHAGTE